MKSTKVFDGDIKIFGPRYSGKLRFLAALAAHHYFPGKRPILSIQANDSGQHLTKMAVDILLNEAKLPPPSFYYGIRPPAFFITSETILRIVELRASYDLCVKAEEWFEIQKAGGDSLNSSIDEYILDDLAVSDQVIFLFDSTSFQRDDQYAQAVSVLRNQLYERRSLPNVKRRYAIIFSKMDLFPGFSRLSDLRSLNSFIKVKFPKLFFEFQKWSRHENCSFRYFACSAFGMMGHPPIRNAVRATNVGSDVDAGCGWVIRKPDFWQPSGLVSPIYWLLSGEKDDPILLDYPSFS